MIELLGLAIREGFGVVMACLLPLFAIAAATAIVVGLLAGALGIRDGALGQIVRALAVILGLGLFAEQIASATVEFAARSLAGPAARAEVDEAAGAEGSR
jgi:type III secretory pathway component EscS